MRKVAQTMLSDGDAYDKVMHVTGLSREDLDEISLKENH